jgi:DNA-binding NarL/FixJ family response regulator
MDSTLRRPTRVAVVDDDRRVRATVSTLLREAGYAVAEAADGLAGLGAVRRSNAEAVVLDISMPGLDGYEVCRRLRQQYGYGIGILFLSGSRCEAFDRVAGLDLGADDYLTKPFEAGELVARVRSVLRRVHAYKALSPARHPLTPRQLEVLLLLAGGASQSDIAERLHVSQSTVRKHIERILRLLNVRSRSEAIAWAFREGIAGQSGAGSVGLDIGPAFGSAGGEGGTYPRSA